MATSTCAPAPSSASSKTGGSAPDAPSDATDPSVPFSRPPSDSDPEALAIQACDNTESLRELLSAYACLEKLIEPVELGDTDQVNPTRTELSALVRLVNEEMQRRIDSIDTTLQSMRSALTEGAAVKNS